MTTPITWASWKFMAKWHTNMVDEFHVQPQEPQPFFSAMSNAGHVRAVTEGCVEIAVNNAAARADAERVVDIVLATEGLWQVRVDRVLDEMRMEPPADGIYAPHRVVEPSLLEAGPAGGGGEEPVAHLVEFVASAATTGLIR